MKPAEFSHWNIVEDTKGLLFFAESLEEMLFHYTHDSHRVPSLNFHFLCIDILTTIRKIDENVCDKANLKPLWEELKDFFNSDPIIQELYGNNFEQLFMQKDVNGSYQIKCPDLFKDPTSDPSMRRIEKALQYLVEDMEIEKKYYLMIREKIDAVVTTTPFGFEEAEQLNSLCRILVADLVNYGYSKEYIYLVVNDLFYNNLNRQIFDTAAMLDYFWNFFDFTERKFTVILPLKQLKLERQLKYFKNLSVAVNTRGYFKNSCHWIIQCEMEAMDPEEARSRTTKLVSFFCSLLQYSNHKSRSYSENQAVVIDKSTQKEYYLQAPISLLRRGSNLGEKQNNEHVAAMVDNFSRFPGKFTSAIELHSAALESRDPGNQLLNLWTIIEVLIPTERKNSFSKINQICNVLTTVLGTRYIYSLIAQLTVDLLHCVPPVYEEIQSNVQKGNSEVEKITAFLVLQEYQGMRKTIAKDLTLYPLLEYRINKYSSIFSDRKKLKNFLGAHAKRLSWQIMRIYRNRNLRNL